MTAGFNVCGDSKVRVYQKVLLMSPLVDPGRNVFSLSLLIFSNSSFFHGITGCFGPTGGFRLSNVATPHVRSHAMLWELEFLTSRFAALTVKVVCAYNCEDF